MVVELLLVLGPAVVARREARREARVVTGLAHLLLGGLTGWSEEGGELLLLLLVVGGRGAEVTIRLLRPALKHGDHFSQFNSHRTYNCKSLRESLFKSGKSFDQTVENLFHMELFHNLQGSHMRYSAYKLVCNIIY